MKATATVLHSVLSCSSESGRIETAIRFLIESWRNSSGAVGPKLIPFEFGSILVALQTAFEVALQLTGRPMHEIILEGLSDLMKRVVALNLVVSECRKDLWSSCLESLWICKFKKELCCWAADFTKYRNKTIHKGDPFVVLSNCDDRYIRIQEIIEMADLLLRNVIRLEAALAITDWDSEILQYSLVSPANSDFRLCLDTAQRLRDS